jgi:hypothetical protein
MKANLAHLTTTTFEEKTSSSHTILLPAIVNDAMHKRSNLWMSKRGLKEVILPLKSQTRNSCERPQGVKKKPEKSLLRNRVYCVGK